MSDVMEGLRKPFPTSKVKKNYRGYDYIPPEHVIDRLNEVLGTDWDFTIIDMQVIGEEVICRGEMTIEGHVRQGIGADEILLKSNEGNKLPDAVGNAHKSAASNCLKLCARLFGVANHLWGGDLLPETSTNQQKESTPESVTTKDTSTPKAETESTPATEILATVEQYNKLVEIGRGTKDDKTLVDLRGAVKKFNVKKLTSGEAKFLIKKYQKTA